MEEDYYFLIMVHSNGVTDNADSNTKPKLSTTERVIQTVPMPTSTTLNISDVFDPKTNKPRPEILKKHFVLEGRIDEVSALKIINEGAALLGSEKTMVEVSVSY